MNDPDLEEHLEFPEIILHTERKNPGLVTTLVSFPPYSKALGIIELASIVGIAPLKNPSALNPVPFLIFTASKINS